MHNPKNFTRNNKSVIYQLLCKTCNAHDSSFESRKIPSFNSTAGGCVSFAGYRGEGRVTSNAFQIHGLRVSINLHKFQSTS